MFKMIFVGFQHIHILSLYNLCQTKKNLEIVACIETAESVQPWANHVNFDNSRSYEEWLASDIDIVAIGACYGDRGNLVLQALQAGKHVIVDKPVCTSLDDLTKISEAVKQKKVQLSCMFDLRYLPSVIQAKKIFAEGQLGRIHNVSFTGQHFLGFLNRPKWYFEDGKHGGTINDIAIHGVDLVNYITGMSIKNVNAARCWNGFAIKEPNFLDCGIFMAELNNGAGLLGDVSYSAPPQAYTMPTFWNFKFWCDQGLLCFNYADKSVYLYPATGDKVKVFNAEDIIVQEDYMEDLCNDIINNCSQRTLSFLSSSRQTLELQQCADKEQELKQ